MQSNALRKWCLKRDMTSVDQSYIEFIHLSYQLYEVYVVGSILVLPCVSLSVHGQIITSLQLHHLSWCCYFTYRPEDPYRFWGKAKVKLKLCKWTNGFPHLSFLSLKFTVLRDTSLIFIMLVANMLTWAIFHNWKFLSFRPWWRQ